MNQKISIIEQRNITKRILAIRGQKVMLDKDLAYLYEIETRVLNQAVKRNLKRFPGDFMFQLTKNDLKKDITDCDILHSLKYSRVMPYVFTEQGIAMLSSVLNSDKAIEINIQIMRTFTKLRELMMEHKDLRSKIEDMEKKYDKQFQLVFNAIKQLLAPPPEKPKRPIGFHV
jgi:hypothetical protein